MQITRAVKIYYRTADGLLAGRCPGGELLTWLPMRVWLSFEGRVDHQSGLIVNVSHIKRQVNDRLSSEAAHCGSIFEIISWFSNQLEYCFEGCRLVKIVLELDDTSYTCLVGRNNMLILTRKYELAASHRLWNDSWDTQQNFREFGKCANPNGHGHNYLLEVSVACDMNQDSGSIDPTEIDMIVNATVMEQFDHKNLCLDIPAMADMVPTVENMAIVIWDILNNQFPNAKLHNIRIWETANTYADYNGK